MSPLATGGMARIYIARSTGIGAFERHVVLKLITPERANDVVAVQMFLDEARLAASLNHQNVAQVFEVGEDGGIHYLAMEYVHGQDLRALLAKAGSQGTRVPLELALTVVAGAAAGLNHAHERRGADGTPLGIVHRDVSPSNIMVGYDGSVKLLDFGIAKATARSVETQSGIIKGKFAYMAPEQCRGRDVDRRSDVFSLGIILYEITTQHRCFRADSDFDTMHRIVTGDVVRPSRLVQGYPQALEAIVMKALAVDANQRYQSAGLLLEALEAFAVAARMSLSTMALGRFMREMFGDHPEPWLTTTGRLPNPLPLPQKESTISSTSDGSQMVGRETAPTAPVQVNVQAGRTLLDLPRGHGEEHEPESEHEDPSVNEWNPKSYPTEPPTYASTSTIPPGSELRPSQLLPSQLIPGQIPGQMPGQMAMGASASGVQPVPMNGAPPTAPSTAPAISTASGAAAFAPGPGTGSSQGFPPVPSTRHSFASAAGLSRPDLSYPRYEPPPESSEELRLKPSRRPFLIGAAVILIVLAVVIAMTIGGSGGNVGGGKAAPATAPEPGPRQTPVEGNSAPPTAPPSGGSAAPVAGATPVAPTVPGTGSSSNAGAGSEQAPIDEDTIGIRVISDPPGADVLLSGKSIGTTPLDRRIKKGTGSEYLTVHRAKYHDVTTRVDLSGDFSKDVTLKKIDEQDDDKKKAEEERKRQEKRAEEKRAEEKRAEEKRQAELRRAEARRQEELRKQQEAASKKPPPAPKCQQPGHYNPYDTSCLGQAGASATGACPVCPDFK